MTGKWTCPFIALSSISGNQGNSWWFGKHDSALWTWQLRAMSTCLRDWGMHVQSLIYWLSWFLRFSEINCNGCMTNLVLGTLNSLDERTNSPQWPESEFVHSYLSSSPSVVTKETAAWWLGKHDIVLWTWQLPLSHSTIEPCMFKAFS